MFTHSLPRRLRVAFARTARIVLFSIVIQRHSMTLVLGVCDGDVCLPRHVIVVLM